MFQSQVATFVLVLSSTPKPTESNRSNLTMLKYDGIIQINPSHNNSINGPEIFLLSSTNSSHPVFLSHEEIRKSSHINRNDVNSI